MHMVSENFMFVDHTASSVMQNEVFNETMPFFNGRIRAALCTYNVLQKNLGIDSVVCKCASIISMKGSGTSANFTLEYFSPTLQLVLKSFSVPI